MIIRSLDLKTGALTVATAVGLLLLDGQLGPVSFQVRRTVAALALAVIALAVSRPPKWRPSASIVTCALLILVMQAPTAFLAMIGYVLAVAMISVGGGKRQLSPGLVQACFTYVGLRSFGELIPQCRDISAGLSTAARAYLRVATGGDHFLGPTALGVPALLLSVAFLLWQWRLSRSRMLLIAAVACPACWFLLLPLAIAPTSAGVISGAVRSTAYSVFCVACVGLIDRIACGLAGSDIPPLPKANRLWLVAACIASLLSGIILVGPPNPEVTVERRILVHNQGGLDWERPIFGRFGAFSGGMFGLFPVYTQAEGFQFDVLARDEVRPSDLLGVQTFVLINSPKVWQGEELRAIRNFVSRGGGLLILGDHTDVFGLMTGFNSLLEGFGIAFRFDSAYQARAGWRGCLASPPDPVAAWWDLEAAGIAVGASLELRGWSRALLLGRYGHSDEGMRSNVVGSFLGNYTYESGEMLGDLPLIALATYGRGRVIVLGDTSPFQGGLSYSFPRTTGPLLNLLSRPTGIIERPTARAFASAFLAAILLGSWACRWGTGPARAIAAAFLVGVAVAWAIGMWSLRAPVTIGRDCVLVDSSHLPAVGHYEAKVNPTGGLDTNLHRSGLRVAYLDDWDRAVIESARGIAFIAPRRPFTRSEVDDLIRFEEAGGTVLVATGQPDSAGCRLLLEAHGLALANRPLGTVPGAGEREKERPRFIDAWPIVTASGGDPALLSGVDVLYRDGEDLVALFRRRGRGGLLLFADTRFFSSMNVEDVSDYWVGNLALIHDVFKKYLGVDPEGVRPMFASPKKPE